MELIISAALEDADEIETQCSLNALSSIQQKCEYIKLRIC